MALAEACRDGTAQIAMIMKMLDQMEKKDNPFGKINDKDKLGETALRWACFNGRKDLVKLLVKRNASVNATNDLNQTSLHSACWNQFPSCCQILITSGANVNAQDRDGCTPLHKVIILFNILNFIFISFFFVIYFLFLEYKNSGTPERTVYLNCSNF